jgi:putative redox protein
MADITIELARIGETTAAEARIRGHRVVMDRPEAKGGGDAGAMGGEMLLASLGGCFMANLIAAAASRGVEVEGLGAVLTGTLDGTPARFTRIAMAISGRAPDGEMEKLIQIAERGCIVRNTLKGSVEITVSRGPARNG